MPCRPRRSDSSRRKLFCRRCRLNCIGCGCVHAVDGVRAEQLALTTDSHGRLPWIGLGHPLSGAPPTGFRREHCHGLPSEQLRLPRSSSVPVFSMTTQCRPVSPSSRWMRRRRTVSDKLVADGGGVAVCRLLSAPLWRMTLALCFCWFSVTVRVTNYVSRLRSQLPPPIPSHPIPPHAHTWRGWRQGSQAPWVR